MLWMPIRWSSLIAPKSISWFETFLPMPQSKTMPIPLVGLAFKSSLSFTIVPLIFISFQFV